jgi:hypothetical protein
VRPTVEPCDSSGKADKDTRVEPCDSSSKADKDTRVEPYDGSDKKLIRASRSYTCDGGIDRQVNLKISRIQEGKKWGQTYQDIKTLGGVDQIY